MSKLSKSDVLKMIDDYGKEARIRREESERRIEEEHKERRRKIEEEHKERRRKIEEEHKERERKIEEEHKERRRKIEEEYIERERKIEEEYEERERRREEEYGEFYKQCRRETHKYNYKYIYPIAAKLYQSSNPTELSDAVLEFTAKGGYIHDNGIDDNVDEGYKQYFNYLKYGIKPYQQEEVKEEPIMIEDNNNYETPYSFEYEPYFSNNNNYSITFDHEVDTSDSIRMIEEMYNEEPVEEEVDSNDVINIMDILSNKVKEVKKTIIHYISNYRPMYNQYTNTIEALLIE